MGHEADGCVFTKIRQMSTPDRLKYMSQLSHEELSLLINKHKICLLNREKNFPFSQLAVL